jgi:hypothetical protein
VGQGACHPCRRRLPRSRSAAPLITKTSPPKRAAGRSSPIAAQPISWRSTSSNHARKSAHRLPLGGARNDSARSPSCSARGRVSLQPGCCRLVGHGEAVGNPSRT